MTKKHLILLTFLTVTLALVLSGCGKSEQNLDGMYIATFDMNQGKLDIMTTEVTTQIHYAYDPGSLILDPATYNNYEILRSGYRFTGWYTGVECKESQRWDFSKDKINQEQLTLYAGWEKEIVYSYTVCYSDGDETVKLGTYSVSAGDVFDDWSGYAKDREGFTPSGYYSDKELTTPWDFASKHPGGATDTDICIYVDYIEGDWILVNNYEELQSAIGGGNIYLTADIDCGGQELSFGREFNYVFEGNGHKITNFTVEQFGTAIMPSVSLFQTLTENAVIRNVAFENVTLKFLKISDNARTIKVAALAKESRGCTVSNVTIKGKLVTTYQEELPRLNEAFYEADSTGELTNFTVEITVEKQS